MIYNISIKDPERNLVDDHDEVSLVYSWEEIQYWHSKGKASLYPSESSIRQSDTLHLEPNQNCELLFKFITFRDTNEREKLSTKDIFKQREVEIVITNTK